MSEASRASLTQIYLITMSEKILTKFFLYQNTTLVIMIKKNISDKTYMRKKFVQSKFVYFTIKS